MSRYVCVHGHFYQPPRENPWLETIERQESAYPYHDWNERVNAECYAPNAASRILDDEGRIVRIVNNYAGISFNMGPSLLAWMEPADPATYRGIVEADGMSRERYGDHGSAMAQVYNHMIMPLSSERDRRTQVLWGVRDFEHRFGRTPDGMWLPETAVDLDTLEALAEAGIRYTVLEPHQAASVRPLAGAGEGGNEVDDAPAAGADGGPEGTGAGGATSEAAGEERSTGGGPAEAGEDVAAGNAGAAEEEAGAGDAGWRDVSGGRIDPTRPYLQRLPSGAEITIFFYDGAVSRAVAFEGLLENGERFADRLMDAFSDEREGDQLAHIGTDGESYGHHHTHGEMALSYALDRIEARDDVELTNYASYLEDHPPRHEVRIVENTSWSCAHGVERWRSDCGCSTGGPPEWNQAWRLPLREALDGLRDRLAPLWEERAGGLLEDPWDARDDYIDVILDRSPENVDDFLATHATRQLDAVERVETLRLLELQRHAMLMYTSCGWFFTELSGIETVQVVEYAGRVIQLAGLLFERDFEGPFLEDLERAHSNLPEQGTGRDIYERRIRPMMVDLRKVCAHHALISLFEETSEPASIYCYDVEERTRTGEEAGRARYRVGTARVRSRITGAEKDFTWAALRFGDHNVHAGVRDHGGEAEVSALEEELGKVFDRADFTAAIRVIDRQFPGETYALDSLFRDEQRRILDRILESSLEDVENVYRQVYERHAPLMRFVSELQVPQPDAFGMAAEFVFNLGLRRELEKETFDPGTVRSMLEKAEAEGVELDETGIAFALQRALERLARRVRESPGNRERLEAFARGVELVPDAPFEVNLWEVQNIYYRILEEDPGGLAQKAAAGDEEARAWIDRLRALGAPLSVAVDLEREAAPIATG